MSRQLAELLAVDRFADGASFGKVGDAQPFCIILMNVRDATFVVLPQRKDATEDLVEFRLCHGELSVFVELCGGEENRKQRTVIMGQPDDILSKWNVVVRFVGQQEREENGVRYGIFGRQKGDRVM